MLKINFTTPVPNEQIKSLIHSFQSIGFKYDRVFQNGEFTIHKFFGTFSDIGLSGEKILNIKNSPNVNCVFESDEIKKRFCECLVGHVELVFLGERRNNL